MPDHNTVLDSLLEQKLLPLFYHEDVQTCTSVLQALYDGGIRVVEFTNRGEAAMANFRALKKYADKQLKDMLLGIGTIKTRKQAKKFAEAGADFLISPIFSAEIAEFADDEELLWIPGCMTPTEIAMAEAAGASLIKIFPGNVLGPSFISAIRELFPDVRFMPTGGVEPEAGNLRSWFQSGVVGVGMGSKLISKELLSTQNYEALKEETAKVLSLVREASI